MFSRFITYGVVGLLTVAVVVAFFRPSTGPTTSRPLSTFIADAKTGHVQTVEVRRNVLTVHLQDGTSYRTRKEENDSVVSILDQSGVDNTTVEILVKGNGVVDDVLDGIGLIIQFIPLILFGALIVWGVRRATQSR